MNTLVEKINVANNGNEIIALLSDTLEKVKTENWDDEVKFTLDELSFHISNWEKGFLLSELRNVNRIEKRINYLNKLDVTQEMRNFISNERNINYAEKMEL